MTTCNYVHLVDSKFISIKGEDRNEFLQDLITNDINKCSKDNPIYSCLLSPQGKFLADFFIINLVDHYLIEINEMFVENFINKLNIYKLRSKININIEENYTSIVILNVDQIFKTDINYITCIDPRHSILGQKIIINTSLKDQFLSDNNLVKIDVRSYRELMIKNLIPDSTKDLKINKSLLLENNFDAINAIDWEKGCYVGQEITARMKYRALLKKSIRTVEIISGSIMPGNKIFYNNNTIGEIISCINNLGIAMLKIEDANDAFNNKNVLKTDSASLKIIH